MTITAHDATTRDPRELCPAESWEVIISDAVHRLHYTQPYAELLLGQFLVWVKARGDNPTATLAMSEPVDQIWHLAMEHSIPYTAITTALTGGYLHHIPPPPNTRPDPDALARTLSALQATGYYVAPECWQMLRSCCPPNPPQPGQNSES